MKKAIIHISDLHVMSNYDKNGETVIQFKSHLNCSNRSKNEEFLDSFISIIQKKFANHIFYLVISGDLSDHSREDEYEELKYVLNYIVKKLSINLKDILIIPGDHDVNWDESSFAMQNAKNGKKAYEFHSEKFKFFTKFYNDFFQNIGKKFYPEKAIVDELVFEDEKIVYIGFNSNYKIGAMSGLGYIDLKSLDKELKDIREKYEEYSKIAVFHHNFNAYYDDSSIGQWDKTNYVGVNKKFLDFKFKAFIYGNEHTPASEKINDQYHISIGSISMKEKEVPLNFKVFEILDNKKNKLELKIKLFETSNYNRNRQYDYGKWKPIEDNTDLDEIKSVVLIESFDEEKFKNKPSETPSEDNFSKADSLLQINKTDIKGIETPKDYKLFSEKNQDHITLLKLIKEKNLFHSGHFHWSKTSRAHNWIDISKLLANKKDLLDTKNYIINIIEENKLSFDFIIGLGIEGNMLATRSSIVYDKDYTFLPYSYRYEDHSKYEQNFNFEYKQDYKTVLIITDVVHDGRTIRKLIHKEGRGKAFFKDVEKIIVIALFYTGELLKEKRNDFNLLNRKYEDDKFDIENDHSEERIQFHFVSHIRVEECPYTKDNFELDCIIVREKLGCIHKFYSGN